MMSKIGIFMADGCEEIEGLTVVDIVRRAKMDITMISVNGKREVTSSHGVTFLADAVAEEVDYGALDGIVLPGGMPGTLHLLDHATVRSLRARENWWQPSARHRASSELLVFWRADAQPAIRGLRKS